MKISRTIFSIACMTALAVLSACALNPFSAAKGTDEKAYAVIGTYQIYQAQVLKVVQDTTLPNDLRSAAANSDKAAYPILKSLNETLTTYLDVKAALDAGATTQDKLAIAIANLKDWTARGQSVVKDVQAAVSNAKKALAKKAASTGTPLNLAIGSA